MPSDTIRSILALTVISQPMCTFAANLCLICNKWTMYEASLQESIMVLIENTSHTSLINFMVDVERKLVPTPMDSNCKLHLQFAIPCIYPMLTSSAYLSSCINNYLSSVRNRQPAYDLDTFKFQQRKAANNTITID